MDTNNNITNNQTNQAPAVPYGSSQKPANAQTPYTYPPYPMDEKSMRQREKLKRFTDRINTFISDKKAPLAVMLLFFLFFLTTLTMFYRVFGGLLVVIGFILFYIIFLVTLPSEKRRFDTLSVILLIANLFLYSSYSFNTNTLTNLVTVPVALVLTALLMMQQSGLSFEAHTLSTPIEAAGVFLSQSISILPAPIKAVSTRLKDHKRGSTLLHVLIGIACTIPFVLILMVLFTSADDVFKMAVENFFKNFDFDDVMLVLLSAGVAIIGSIGVSAVLYSVANSEEYEFEDKEKKERLSAAAVSAFLVILTLLEGFFGFVQIRSLFTGKIPEGVNYAEYARSGFFYIAGATALTVAIIAAVYFICGKLKTVVKAMLTLFSGCALILFASAYFRMYMYMTVHGLTVKRVAVCWLITLLLALLVGIVIKVWNDGFALFGYTVAAVVLFAVCLNVMRLDTLVSKYNVNLYLNNPSETQEMDLDYLITLSPEALPQIARLEGSNYNSDIVSRAEKVMAYKLKTNRPIPCAVNFNLGDVTASKIVKEKNISYNSDNCEYWIWEGLKYESYDEEYSYSGTYEHNLDMFINDSLYHCGIYSVRSDIDEDTAITDDGIYLEIKLNSNEIDGVQMIADSGVMFFKPDAPEYEELFSRFANVYGHDDRLKQTSENGYIAIYNVDSEKAVLKADEPFDNAVTMVQFEPEGIIRIYSNSTIYNNSLNN